MNKLSRNDQKIFKFVYRMPNVWNEMFLKIESVHRTANRWLEIARLKNVYINISLNLQIYHILKQFNTSIDFSILPFSFGFTFFRFITLNSQHSHHCENHFCRWEKRILLTLATDIYDLNVASQIELTKQTIYIRILVNPCQHDCFEIDAWDCWLRDTCMYVCLYVYVHTSQKH